MKQMNGINIDWHIDYANTFMQALTHVKAKRKQIELRLIEPSHKGIFSVLKIHQLIHAKWFRRF